VKSKIFYIHAKDHSPAVFNAFKAAVCIAGLQRENFVPFDFGNITLNLIGPPGGETSFAIVLWVAEGCPQAEYNRMFNIAQDLHNRFISNLQTKQTPTPPLLQLAQLNN